MNFMGFCFLSGGFWEATDVGGRGRYHASLCFWKMSGAAGAIEGWKACLGKGQKYGDSEECTVEAEVTHETGLDHAGEHEVGAQGTALSDTEDVAGL